MSKRKVPARHPSDADESNDLFSSPKSVDRNPADVRAPKASEPVAEPLDDFEFPPELQLPTMEALLEPPRLTPEPADAPPEPVVVEPASEVSPRRPRQRKRREDAPVVTPEVSPDIGQDPSESPVFVQSKTSPESRDTSTPVAPAAERRVVQPPAARQPPAAVSAWAGVVFVGDLHLASRVPGFRCDDYPQAILRKLRWVIEYARAERLLPVLLGDLFDFPRDNANWLLVELHHLLDPHTPAIYGNHDCKENAPGDHDTVSILVASGLLRLLSEDQPWTGDMNGCRVVIGGTSWGQKLPKAFDCASRMPEPDATPTVDRPAYVLWATHHDLRFPGFEEAGRMDCREVPGIDLVVNGHIHRELQEVASGRTRWMNPGSLCRISRSDASRDHVPGVLRVDVSESGLAYRRVEVPHEAFETVFHPEVESAPVEVRQSLFIRDLEKLQSMRTSCGLGLREFLDANLSQFEPKVSDEIRRLAEEVLSERAKV